MAADAGGATTVAMVWSVVGLNGVVEPPTALLNTVIVVGPNVELPWLGAYTSISA